jgi:hypothetical protein
MNKLAMIQDKVCARPAAIARGNIGGFIDRGGRGAVADVKAAGRVVEGFTRGKDGL